MRCQATVSATSISIRSRNSPTAQPCQRQAVENGLCRQHAGQRWCRARGCDRRAVAQEGQWWFCRDHRRLWAEHNAIVFPVHMLTHPLRGADPVLHSVLRRLTDHELAQLQEQELSAFPRKVRVAIERELEAGAPLERVAARMHLSPGGLRSRLRQHGATYSRLLDTVRKEHARRALRDTQLGISELAHQLGFAHPPAFHRAFRRWFGVTPNAYREIKSDHPAARFWRSR